MRDRLRKLLWLAVVAAMLAGCGAKATEDSPASPPSSPVAAAHAPAPAQSPAAAPSQAPAPSPAPISMPAVAPAPSPAPVSTPAVVPAPAPSKPSKTVAAIPLKFSELYAARSVTEGLKLSEKLLSLSGQRVTMAGYMAPPLKPSFTFFILSKTPLALCPFCSSDADWPDDIVMVILSESRDASAYTTALTVTGRLEVGGKTDPESGFYSVIRIYADSIGEVH